MLLYFYRLFGSSALALALALTTKVLLYTHQFSSR